MQEIEAAGGTARAFHLDVTSEAGWADIVAFALSEFGRLDVLVNNAGIGDSEAIEVTSYETYQKVVAVTQTSVFLGEKAAAEALKASGNGAVVNVSSMFGIVGGFGTSPAPAAKGAVRTLTKKRAGAGDRGRARELRAPGLRRHPRPGRDRPQPPGRHQPRSAASAAPRRSPP